MSLKHVPMYSSFSENLGERTGRDRDGRQGGRDWQAGFLSGRARVDPGAGLAGWLGWSAHCLDGAMGRMHIPLVPRLLRSGSWVFGLFITYCS